MIAFRKLEVTDRALVQSFTMKSKRMNCDLAFSNLFSWRFLYQTEVAVVDNFLAFRFYSNDKLSYMMPVGEEDPSTVVSLLIEDARRIGQPFCMLGVCDFAKNDIEKIRPGEFTFSIDRDYSDYIYLRSDLAELVGKKFQAKRNHVNKFKKSYNYEYKEITRDIIPLCLELEAEWCKNNNCDESQALVYEKQSLTNALAHFEELGLVGGMLLVDGKIVAFTYGGPINERTFDVNIEKANADYEGVYAMINNEFAKHLPEQYIYINREEDLGLEGLRKAKLSYQPVMLLDKCMACRTTEQEVK